MKLFFIYCLIAGAGVGFLTFFNNPDAWHGLVVGIGFYLTAVFIVQHKDAE